MKEIKIFEIIKNNDLKQLKEFIKNNKKINFNLIKNEYGQSLIHTCSIYNCFKCLEYLILNCDININLIDNNNNSALHFACGYNNIEIIELLLKKGIDINIKNNINNIAFDLLPKNIISQLLIN